MKNYGFSIALGIDSNIDSEIIEYFMNYKIIEIKIKKKDYMDFIDYIKRIISNYPSALSLHLDSDLLQYNNIASDYLKKIGESISENTKLITHFNEAYDNIEIVLNSLGEKGVLLIENEKGESLKFINHVEGMVKEYLNNERVGLCVDIGHLIYDLGYPRTLIIVEELFKKYGDKIHELHFHDVMNGKDHCDFTVEGELFYRELIELLKLNSVRIIFEIKNIDVLSSEAINIFNRF